ncbi:hypothetical protein CYMTET_9842 [Cymbomonas tetramitiformis]|uniref:Uncharacterized protein n=1 Tax=Cymbomonas tetramitiformis TaxID=36881 RepID=A0AAE0GQF7_9CHLO|nr:hypothetical protein CYMTET_9842 [Cymbomonas tetramitiformis]
MFRVCAENSESAPPTEAAEQEFTSSPPVSSRDVRKRAPKRGRGGNRLADDDAVSSGRKAKRAHRESGDGASIGVARQTESAVPTLGKSKCFRDVRQKLNDAFERGDFATKPIDPVAMTFASLQLRKQHARDDIDEQIKDYALRVQELKRDFDAAPKYTSAALVERVDVKLNSVAKTNDVRHEVQRLDGGGVQIDALRTRDVPKLLAGIKCFVCHGYGSPRLFCRNGHTICEDCDKSPKVATLNVCGLCDAPRLRGGVRLPAVLDDMYADAQDQVCPLCTDDTPRSVKELLRHVHHCSAVRTEEIRTNKYELMATRERWEMEACAILGRPEFVDEIRERMTVAFAHELYESDKKIDRLEKQLLAVERLNSELEKEAADTKELNAELVAEIKNRQKRDRDESASVMNADSKRVPEKSKRLRRELREEL